MIESITYLIITFVITAIVGKFVVPILKKLKVGQSEREDGPRTHLRKKGTPTMGGIMMLISVIIVVLIITFVNKEMAKIILPITLSAIGFGIVGFIDDFKKVILKNTEGLNPKLKMLGLLIVSAAYTLFIVKYSNVNNEVYIPILKLYISLPVYLYIPAIIFVMLGTTNAVNLNDGVDGLCATCTAISFVGFSVIGLKINYPSVSVISAIFAGACAGFLIYNFHKAKVFMGDMGSLMLGGALASIAIFMKLPLLLVIMAIIPVCETVSVILQVLSVRFTGKRIFKMTPLHHHFELIGWRENKVVGVFATITLIASVIGILLV